MKSLLQIATEIAEQAHTGQFRRDGITPYITHPEAVVKMLHSWLNEYEIFITQRYYTRILDTNIKIIGIINKAYDIWKRLPYSGISFTSFYQIITAVGICHDSKEDCEHITNNFIWEKILQNHYPNHEIVRIFITAVDAITKQENEVYLNYILRVKDNPIARIVKIADITHNISTRNGANTAGDRKRDKIAIDKYELAKYILLN